VGLRDAARRLKPSAQRQNNKQEPSDFQMDVNAGNNIDSDEVTTPALHARHKNLTKSAKIKENS
jgi:hypothetical protein